MAGQISKRHLFRIVVPAFPSFNIYWRIAKKTTALGPISVATSAHELPGWDVEVIDENNYRRYGPTDSNGHPDHELLQQQRPAEVVGLYGGLTSTIPRLYEIAKFYKTRNVITVAGGQHFFDETINEALSSGIDYVVMGEAEETIKELLRAITHKEEIDSVKGIAYRDNNKIIKTEPREALTEFRHLPIPDFGLLRYAKIKIYPVERVRGCGMNCEFCTVKGKPRAATPQRLFEQIAHLVESRGARHFFIVDDLFGQHRTETISFCRMLCDYQKQIGKRLHTTVQIRLDKAEDTELLAAMRQAGITNIAIGIESPINEELVAMNKHLKAEEMLSMLKVFNKFGFWVHGMFIFGYPLKEPFDFDMPINQRIKRYRDFIKKAKIDTIQVLLAVPLPGTELRRRLAEQNRIYPKTEIGWEYYDGTFPLYEPDKPYTALQMQTAAVKIMGKFYRFKYMFLIGLNVLSFPSIIFLMGNINRSWSRWYRKWRRNLIHFGGWIMIKNWAAELRKNSFSEKLQKARIKLNNKNH